MSRGPVVEIAGERYRREAIEVDLPVDPKNIFEAIVAAGEDAEEGTQRVQRTADEVTVAVPTPPPVYDHIGYVHEGMGIRSRTALAKAARTVGGETPYDDSLAAARAKLAAMEAEQPEPERDGATRTTDTAKITQLREQAATLRGRIATRREQGMTVESVQTELEDVLARLSEAETAAQAAQQRRDRARAAVRDYRDSQEQRFRLEDNVANLERNARASLVEQYAAELLDHVQALSAVVDELPPAETLTSPARDESPVDAGAVDWLTTLDPVVVALALVRFASFDTPVVLSCSQFDSAADAVEILDVPVIRI